MKEAFESSFTTVSNCLTQKNIGGPFGGVHLSTVQEFTMYLYRGEN